MNVEMGKNVGLLTWYGSTTGKKNGDKYAKRKQTGTDDIRKFVRRSYEELDKRCREDDKRFGNPMNMDKSTSTAIIDTYVLLQEAEAPRQLLQTVLSAIDILHLVKRKSIYQVYGKVQADSSLRQLLVQPEEQQSNMLQDVTAEEMAVMKASESAYCYPIHIVSPHNSMESLR